MARIYFKTFIVIAFVFIIPFSVFASDNVVSTASSVCETTMSHTSITAHFLNHKSQIIYPGETFKGSVEISNKTSYAFKNTRILYKIYYYDKNSLNTKGDTRLGQLVDIQIDPTSYDVLPFGKTIAEIKWQSPSNSEGGLYRMDIYVSQNGVHVIGDFARVATAVDSSTFKIDGTKNELPLSIDLSKTKIEGKIYEAKKMMVFKEDENTNKALVAINNSSENEIIANFTWRVFPYGLFEDKDALISTSSIVSLKSKSDTYIPVELSSVPANRYHTVITVEYNGQKRSGIMRYAKWYLMPPVINTYGIIKEDKFLTSDLDSASFALKKGQKYVVFACLIGGYKNASTTVFMQLKDSEGEIIYSNKDTQETGATFTAYEYIFIPKKYTNKMQLEIDAKTEKYLVKTAWENDCRESKSAECQNDSLFERYKMKYVIPAIIIIFLFMIAHVIKNKSLYKYSNEK